MKIARDFFLSRSAVSHDRQPGDPAFPLASFSVTADRPLRRRIVLTLGLKVAFLSLLWLLFFSDGREAPPQSVADHVLPAVSVSTEGK